MPGVPGHRAGHLHRHRPYGDTGLELGVLVDPSCRTTTTSGVTAPLPGRVLELFRDTGLASILSELIGPRG